MGFFNKVFNSGDKNSEEVFRRDVEQIMNAYSLILKNAEELNCKYISIGPYWVEFDGIVTFGSGAIAVGVSDFQDCQINAGLAERLGLALSCLQGRTYAQLRIGADKTYTRKQKAAIIENAYKKLQELYPEGFPHTYDNKGHVIAVIL